MRREWHAIDRDRPATTGSNEVGEALPPNAIGHTTGRTGKQRKPPALNRLVHQVASAAKPTGQASWTRRIRTRPGTHKFGSFTTLRGRETRNFADM